MGYQITFKPSQEKMDAYKPWKEESYNEEERNTLLETVKRELIHYCLKPTEDSVYLISKNIKQKLNGIMFFLKEQVKYDTYFRWKESDDKTVNFCGWEFSRDSDFSEEEIVKNAIENLSMLCDVVTTPDYFDKNEKFYTKWNHIKEEVDNFVDIYYDILEHNICDDLREFELGYDDDDNEYLVNQKKDEV